MKLEVGPAGCRLTCDLWSRGGAHTPQAASSMEGTQEEVGLWPDFLLSVTRAYDTRWFDLRTPGAEVRRWGRGAALWKMLASCSINQSCVFRTKAEITHSSLLINSLLPETFPVPHFIISYIKESLKLGNYKKKKQITKLNVYITLLWRHLKKTPTAL